jgi:hypothetical protein
MQTFIKNIFQWDGKFSASSKKEEDSAVEQGSILG